MNCKNKKCDISRQAGKGDKPRNCFSKKFKDNYDLIKWEFNKKDNAKGK